MEHFLKASHRLSPTTVSSHVMWRHAWCPEKFERDQTRSVSRKRGDWICLKPESSQKPKLFVDAVPCPWCVPCCQHPLPVFLSSCSAVQNHVDRPTVTTPAWVWTTPRRTVCLLPLHVCVRVLPIVLCMWTSLSDKTSVNCVFLCACQWPRGTTGPRNYLSVHSCISTAVD